MKTPEGRNTLYSFTVERPTGVFTAGYTEFPAAQSIVPSKFMIDQFRDGMIEEVGPVKLLGEKNLSLKNTAGRAVTFRDRDGVTYAVRIYRTKAGIYHLAVATFPGGEKRTAAAVQTFLSSFTLLNQSRKPAQPVAWTRFSSAPGNFSVVLPGQPTQQTITKESPVGMLKFPVFLRTDESVLYTLMYIDFPDPALVKDSQQVLDEYQEGMLIGINNKLKEALGSTGGTTKLKLISQRRLTLQEWPGREIRLRDAIGMIHRARFFLIQQRLFSLNASTAGENESRSAKDIERFLESFTMLSPPATGNIS